MRDNLRLYHKVERDLVKMLAGERVTRVRNLALLVTGLYASMSVHLPRIAARCPQRAQVRSLVVRLQRFVANPAVEVARLWRPLVGPVLAPYGQGQPLTLLVDLTKVGARHRLLTAALAWRKRALPLAWRALEGVKGHASAKTVITLLQQVQALLPAGHGPVTVVADSGFQAVDTAEWVQQQGWDFVLRLRAHTTYQAADGRWRQLRSLKLAPGEVRCLGAVPLTRRPHGVRGYVVVYRGPTDEQPWYLWLSRPEAWWGIRTYRRRVWTEALYGDLKRHGFHLEHTRLATAARIERLMLAVAWTYIWLLTLGGWVVKRGLRRRIDVASRRDKSYFRLGCDWMAECFRLGWPLRLHCRPYP